MDANKEEDNRHPPRGVTFSIVPWNNKAKPTSSASQKKGRKGEELIPTPLRATGVTVHLTGYYEGDEFCEEWQDDGGDEDSEV